MFATDSVLVMPMIHVPTPPSTRHAVFIVIIIIPMIIIFLRGTWPPPVESVAACGNWNWIHIWHFNCGCSCNNNPHYEARLTHWACGLQHNSDTLLAFGLCLQYNVLYGGGRLHAWKEVEVDCLQSGTKCFAACKKCFENRNNYWGTGVKTVDWVVESVGNFEQPEH